MSRNNSKSNSAAACSTGSPTNISTDSSSLSSLASLSSSSSSPPSSYCDTRTSDSSKSTGALHHSLSSTVPKSTTAPAATTITTSLLSSASNFSNNRGAIKENSSNISTATSTLNSKATTRSIWSWLHGGDGCSSNSETRAMTLRFSVLGSRKKTKSHDHDDDAMSLEAVWSVDADEDSCDGYDIENETIGQHQPDQRDCCEKKKKRRHGNLLTSSTSRRHKAMKINSITNTIKSNSVAVDMKDTTESARNRNPNNNCNPLDACQTLDIPVRFARQESEQNSGALSSNSLKIRRAELGVVRTLTMDGIIESFFDPDDDSASIGPNQFATSTTTIASGTSQNQRNNVVASSSPFDYTKMLSESVQRHDLDRANSPRNISMPLVWV